MRQIGKVWLVGAGPGSSDLLTVKAQSLLDTGDCIVYDRLVGREVLAMLPADKELIDVGKSAGHQSPSLRSIRSLSEKQSLARR